MLNLTGKIEIDPAGMTDAEVCCWLRTGASM